MGGTCMLLAQGGPEHLALLDLAGWPGLSCFSFWERGITDRRRKEALIVFQGPWDGRGTWPKAALACMAQELICGSWPMGWHWNFSGLMPDLDPSPHPVLLAGSSPCGYPRAAPHAADAASASPAGRQP